MPANLARDPNCPSEGFLDNTPPAWLESNRIVQTGWDLPGYTQVMDPIVLAASGGAGQVGAEQTITFVTRVPFLWTQAFASRTGRFRERINAAWQSNYLDNTYVKDQLFWGSGQNPTIIATTFLPANQTVSIQVADLSGSANTVIFGFGGFIVPDNRLDEVERKYGKGKNLMRLCTPQAPVSTVLRGVAIPANGTANFAIGTETAYHFRWDQTCTEQTSVNWSGYAEHKDVRLNYRYANANQKMPSYLWTGRTAGLNADGTGAAKPYINPSPILAQCENAITFNVADASGSTNYLDVCLIGARESVCRLPARGVARCV